MAILAFGNRLLWYGRSSSAISMSSVVGSPALFNTAVVSEGASIPQQAGAGGIGLQSVGYVHTSGVGRAWFHWDQATDGGGGPGAFTSVVQIVSTTGQVLADIYFQSSGTWWFRAVNGAGTLTNRGAAIAPMVSGLTTYDVDFTAGVNGSVNMYRGGVLWHSASWTDGLAAQIAGIRIFNFANVTNRTVVSQFAMSDGDDLRGFLVQPTVITGTGVYNDGTGVPADTGDLNVLSAKSLSAAAQKWTGTKPAITPPAGASVEQVAVNMLARASAPVPNGRLIVRHSSTDAFSAGFTPALAGGYTPRSFVLPTDPVTGFPWVLANLNAAQIGVEALA